MNPHGRGKSREMTSGYSTLSQRQIIKVYRRTNESYLSRRTTSFNSSSIESIKPISVSSNFFLFLYTESIEIIHERERERLRIFQIQ